jgi:hypothetical protein
MFEVAARQNVPTAVAAHVASFLDLASHSCLKRASRTSKLTCELRAASPVIVCCRNLPMRVAARVPRERYARRTERVFKKMHDVHKKGYGDSPSALYMSDSGCELDRILPGVLPRDSSLWSLAPRVLDLHHVRLQPAELAEIVGRMPTIDTLCMNACDIPQLSVLRDLVRLQSLCLYSVSEQWASDDLGDLTSLRRLTFPVTTRFVDYLASMHDTDRPPLPPRLTCLTLWRDPFDMGGRPLHPLNWMRLLAAVPLLQQLITHVLLPSVSTILPLVPELRELKGVVRERAVTGEFVRPMSSARRLTLLHYDSGGGRCPKITALLNPETLVELVWYHWWGPQLLAETLMPMVTDIARFHQLRILRLSIPAHVFDAVAFERLCRSLLSLETLAMAVPQPYSLVHPPVASELALRDDGARFLQPLALLKRLHTLRFRAVRNIAACELPHLPQLTEYATNAAPATGRTIRQAFPNLTQLSFSAPVDTVTLNDLARLPFLRHLIFGSGCAVDVAALVRFSHVRRQHGPHESHIVLEVPWCHNPLRDAADTMQSGSVVISTLTSIRNVQCVCVPSPHDGPRACRQLEEQPYSEAEIAEMRAADKDGWFSDVCLLALVALTAVVFGAFWFRTSNSLHAFS